MIVVQEDKEETLLKKMKRKILTEEEFHKYEYFLWDGARDRDTLIFRRMLYDHPALVLKDYSRRELKKILFERWHLFDELNLNFWKTVLEVRENEFRRKRRKDFRTAIRIWSY